MPFFAGYDLGQFCYGDTEAEPNDVELTAFSGVDGLTMLNLGARGNTTTITGACYANDLYSLGQLKESFRNLQRTVVLGTLIDTEGTAWNNVVLMKFKTTSEIITVPNQVPGFGVIQDCFWTFLHLSSN